MTRIRSARAIASSSSSVISSTPTPRARHVEQQAAHRLDGADVEPAASATRRSATVGSALELAGQQHLLHVAARQHPRSASPATGALTPNRSISVLGVGPHRGAAEERARPRSAARRYDFSTRLSSIDADAGQAGVEPVLGDVGDAGLDQLARIAAASSAARRRRPSPSRGARRADRLGQLALTVAGHAAHGRRSRRRAGRRSRRAARAGRDRRRRRGRSTASTTRSRSTGGRCAAPTSDVNTTSRPTMIRASSRVDVSATSTVPTLRAVAQHGDAIGHRHHLVELVRDEHDRPALGRHRPQRLEQHLGLLRREHGGRLVEDQHRGVACERLEDLDPLLLADRQLPDLGRRDRPAGRSARRAPPPARRSTRCRTRPRPPSTMFSATVNVRHQVEVLVHHADALRRARRGASASRCARPRARSCPRRGGRCR